MAAEVLHVFRGQSPLYGHIKQDKSRRNYERIKVWTVHLIKQILNRDLQILCKQRTEMCLASAKYLPQQAHHDA